MKTDHYGQVMKNPDGSTTEEPAITELAKETPLSGSERRLVVRCGNQCFRVVQRPNVWVEKAFFYPEQRPKWWPFWFRYEDGSLGQLFFRTEQEAWDFLRRRNFSHNV